MASLWAVLGVLATVAVEPARTVTFRSGGSVFLAALSEGQLQLAHAGRRLHPRPPLAADGFALPAAGPGGLGLYAARGATVVCLDGAHGEWREVATLSQPVAQLVAAPDDGAAMVVLTGLPGEPVLRDGAVWRLPLAPEARPLRLASVRDGYRPWRLWPTGRDGQAHLAVGAYRATRLAPFEHRCMFVYRWSAGGCEPVWLGSRLGRPYVDAAHADLRGDGQWRMIAVEETEDGGRGLGIYRPLSFGYEGEWRTEALAGLREVAAWGPVVVVGGDGWAARLQPEREGYRLVRLPVAPPALAQAVVWQGQLAGWWDGQWQPPASEGSAP
jgi:hypothetical protein